MSRRPSFFHHLHPPTIPAREARFRHTFGLGGVSFFLFLSLVLTGALELFYYVPSVAEANESVQLLTYHVSFGWLLRGLHYWAAQALVATTVLHLIRVVLTGGYKPPRRFNWLLGLSLLLAMLLLNFSGYVLRWDRGIAWALLVGTNLLRSIPGIGGALHNAVVGGAEIGAATVVRFYGWHIFGLALPAFGVMAWHLFRVRRDGGIAYSPPLLPQFSGGERGQGDEGGKKRIPRDVLVQREALAALLASVLLLLLAVLFPPALGPAADFDNLPTNPVAPWFFIWVQELLRLGDPLLMGVLVPLGLLILLALLPYVLDRSETGSARWFNPGGRRAQVVVLAVVGVLIALTLQGALR